MRVNAEDKPEHGKVLALKTFSKMVVSFSFTRFAFFVLRFLSLLAEHLPLSLIKVWDERSFDSLLLEKQIMLDIKPHPFVLQLHSTFQDSDHLYMLTELCQVIPTPLYYPQDKLKYQNISGK